MAVLVAAVSVCPAQAETASGSPNSGGQNCQDLPFSPLSDLPIQEERANPLKRDTSILIDLRVSVSLLKQPDFYAVIGGLSAIPSLIEYESLEINRRWMGPEAADSWFEAGETLGNTVLPFAVTFAVYSLGKYCGSPEAVSAASDLFCVNVINSLLTASIKVGGNRKRPDGDRISVRF
ncbi:MAG: hypothetical protein ACE5OR_01285 [bacterium]